MLSSSKIFVAGHLGLVGSAIVRSLQQQDFSNLLVRTRAELDLTNQAAVNKLFDQERPEYVFMAAARVATTSTSRRRHPGQFNIPCRVHSGQPCD